MLIYNAAKCVHCGDIIVSRHRHDFVKCSCDSIFVDGGLEYERRGYRLPSDYINLSKYSNESFEVIREYFSRYNRFSNSYVLLKDISDEWLQNIIDYYIQHNLQFHKVFRIFVEEKLYRAENEVFVLEESKYELDF
jgi:hypothetical protein